MQPLHCGFLGDLGGNKIQLHWYHRKANLHHVSILYKDFICRAILELRDSLQSRPPRDGGIGLPSFPPSADSVLGGTDWDDGDNDDDDDEYSMHDLFPPYTVHPDIVFISTTCVLFQVWDTEIIDTALKRFYDSDLNIMIETVQKNITVNSWFFRM